MNPPEIDKIALIEAVTCTLSCALQADSNVQKVNNERIKNLEVIEEYPLILCEIIGMNEEALAERHLASVFLKNYLQQIFTHTRENPGFYPKEIGKRLCLMLLDHLDIQYTNIKLMVTYSIAILLGLGFWDTLTLQLNDMVQSEDPETINNAVLVLAQAIDKKFFESGNNFTVEQHWFNVLLDVFKMTNIRSETRLTVIRPIFMMMKYVRPNESYLPECCSKLSIEFEKALNESFSPNSDFQFKGEIVKCLNSNIEEFSEYSSIFITPSLPVIAKLLTHCCEIFKKVVRNSEKMPPKDISEAESEDPTNFTDLVASILSFIHTMIDMIYFDLLIGDFENLLYCLFVFMACYDDMEFHLYTEAYDHHFGMRQIACEIITSSIQKLEETRPDGKAVFFKHLHHVYQRFTGELEAAAAVHMDQNKVIYMTRITEAMIFGLAMVKEKISSTDPDFVFPVEHYINYWIKVQSSKHINMFLTARIIWMCGVFCLECSPNVIGFQLKVLLQKLSGDSKYLFIPSASTLCSFLKNIKKMSEEQRCVISNFARDIIICLIGITRKEEDFPINHALNAFGFFIKSFKEIAKNNIDVIEDILIKAISNHISNPRVLREIHFVVAKLAQNLSFKILIHDKFLTFMFHVIHNYEPSHLRGYLDKALEILHTYSLYSRLIDEYLLLQLFMGGAKLMNKVIEPQFEVEESAAMLLTTLIIKQIDRLKFIQQTPKGEPVIQEYPKLLEMMLRPDVVLPAHVCDKLIIASIFQFSELMEPHIENILRNIITANCKHQKNIIPTWIIFIFICMIRTSDTLGYLSVVPGPNGGSALNYIMKAWVPDYVHQVDQIERKFIVLSISRVIQNCLENESDYSKMEEVCIPYDKPNTSSPSGEVFNGMEYLYYLLIGLLLFEDKQPKPTPPGPIFEDFGEDIQTRHLEDDVFLFHDHPLNIDIINHTVTFLKTGNELYFNIIRKFISMSDYYKLRDLGCNVPDLGIQEVME